MRTEGEDVVGHSNWSRFREFGRGQFDGMASAVQGWSVPAINVLSFLDFRLQSYVVLVQKYEVVIEATLSSLYDQIVLVSRPSNFFR